jgi:Leucine-rich repeat (LRR) protein
MVKRIDISNTDIKKLPFIPKNTTEIRCQHNKLNSIDKLPPRLKELYCHDNEITHLSNLPDTLRELYCENNRMKYIPRLPKSLEIINMDNNPLDEGYKECYEEYSETHDINILRKCIKNYKPVNTNDEGDSSSSENEMDGGYKRRGRGCKRSTRRKSRKPKALHE